MKWVPGAPPLGLKRPGREADHSPPYSAEVSNKVWGHTSNPLYASMEWSSDKRGTGETLLFIIIIIRLRLIRLFQLQSLYPYMAFPSFIRSSSSPSAAWSILIKSSSQSTFSHSLQMMEPHRLVVSCFTYDVRYVKFLPDCLVSNMTISLIVHISLQDPYFIYFSAFLLFSNWIPTFWSLLSCGSSHCFESSPSLSFRRAVF
jgi:hypothetical protein